MSELDKIAPALIAAMKEIRNPGFDSTNPHFKNRFASLAAVREAVLPVMAKHGIAVNQALSGTDRGVSCTTVFTHESGQQMSFGPLELPAAKMDPQGFGSAATYARRYGLMAAACVVGDDDDDAERGTAAVNTPPAGYAEWKANMQAVADEGTDALRKAWEGSDITLRTWATERDNWLPAAKAKAAKVK